MAERLTGPKMLALVGDRTGPSLWRVFTPMTALEKAGYRSGWDMNDNDLVSTVAHRFDGFILPRISWQPEHREMAVNWFAAAHRAGKFCVYETDDDGLTRAETERRIELQWTDGKSFERLEQERAERIWCMQQCDGVTVSTPRLATIVRQFTDKPVIVVPNAIDLPWFQGIIRGTERQIPGLTIGWAGGRRHDRDVADMAIAWGHIARRYPSVTFVIMGHQPPVVDEHVPADRIARLPWMPLEQYPAGYKEIDIGCAAIADIPFNRAKSPIKALEYGAAGAAVVASPLLYSSIIDHGSSGFIADSAAEWEDALSELIERPSLRSMMAGRLLKTIKKHHTLAGNLANWPNAWSRIAESVRRPSLLMPAFARSFPTTGAA